MCNFKKCFSQNRLVCFSTKILHSTKWCSSENRELWIVNIIHCVKITQVGLRFWNNLLLNSSMLWGTSSFTVKHFGYYAYSLSCQELKQKFEGLSRNPFSKMWNYSFEGNLKGKALLAKIVSKIVFFQWRFGGGLDVQFMILDGKVLQQLLYFEILDVCLRRARSIYLHWVVGSDLYEVLDELRRVLEVNVRCGGKKTRHAIKCRLGGGGWFHCWRKGRDASRSGNEKETGVRKIRVKTSYRRQCREPGTEFLPADPSWCPGLWTPGRTDQDKSLI